MKYVFDTSSFLVTGHYFPKQFSSLWNQLGLCVANGDILSVREVYRELDSQATRPHLRTWVKSNRHIFLRPTAPETDFVSKIFSVPHFLQLVSEKQRLKGTPVADPFVIACAKVNGACVVTEESMKSNAAKIPNICSHFGVACMNLEGFMTREGWSF